MPVQLSQGEVWWVDLGEPSGSVAGYRRPVIVIQGDEVNQSRIRTAICVPLTGNTKWGAIPTCLTLLPSATGLDYTSVARTTQILAVDEADFIEAVGRIPERQLLRLFDCLDIALGRAPA
jgi:mRNA interferase MazF